MFERGGIDDIKMHLTRALDQKSWVPNKQTKQMGFRSSGAGIGGLIRRQQEAQRENHQLAAEAFADLEALMAKARDVVTIVERYATVTSAETSDKGEPKEKNNLQLNSLLLDIGIDSPVTKESAGALYHQELARQLAQFL